MAAALVKLRNEGLRVPHLAEVLRQHPYFGEDLPKAAATIRVYDAAKPHAGDATSAEAASFDPIEPSDPATIRRQAAYVGLIQRGVSHDEAGAVAALIPAG